VVVLNWSPARGGDLVAIDSLKAGDDGSIDQLLDGTADGRKGPELAAEKVLHAAVISARFQDELRGVGACGEIPQQAQRRRLTEGLWPKQLQPHQRSR
jgi:hypothetical protein